MSVPAQRLAANRRTRSFAVETPHPGESYRQAGFYTCHPAIGFLDGISELSGGCDQGLLQGVLPRVPAACGGMDQIAKEVHRIHSMPFRRCRKIFALQLKTFHLAVPAGISSTAAISS